MIDTDMYIMRLNHNSAWARWSGPWERSGPQVLELVMRKHPGQIFALLPGSKLWSEATEYELKRRDP
jgi:hypothetical protein